MIYFNEQEYSHAADVLKRGLEVNSEMPTASAMLGLCYFQLGEHEKANLCCERPCAPIQATTNWR